MIHCLAPVMRSSVTRVRIAPASEPLPDSVSANAESSSPRGQLRHELCDLLGASRG